MSEPILSPSFLNTAVKPGTDFYEYAVGRWIKDNPIPPEYSRWGDFEILVERNYGLIREQLEHVNRFAGTPEELCARLAGKFFESGMDEARIEAAGVKPLTELFVRIKAVRDARSLAQIVAELHRTLGFPFFYFGSTPDSKASSQVIAGLGQGGLGLPDRDYYLNDEAKFKEAREKYVPHINTMFALASLKEEMAGEIVLRLETELAKVSKTRVELRDPTTNYHKMTLSQLVELSPNFDWKVYFDEINFRDTDAIDVGQLEFFRGLSELFATISLVEWRVYLLWHALHEAAPFLSKLFVDEHFAFYRQYLVGQKVQKPRFKRVIDALKSGLGQAVGRLYVKEYFPPAAKTRAEVMVRNIQEALRERIHGLAWMEAKTKVAAEKKLDAILVKIGYPDKWIDYSKLTIDSPDYLTNVQRAREFEFLRDVAKIGKPVDRTEWMMDPHEINAYYSPLHNEIVFPAGILQPPFFSVDADDAVNYGGIGAVIGHEITHGFDDQGRQYDAEGNLEDWWTPADGERFKKAASRLVEQFNKYESLPGLHVNGELTLGENIADLAGLTIAYLAFEKTLAGNEPALIDGFTARQRFFWSWANTWKENLTDELRRMYVVVDPHSPPRFRTNGPLSNLAWFFEAFGVGEGEPMYRSEQDCVVVW